MPGRKLKPSDSTGFWVTLESNEEIGWTRQPNKPQEWSLTIISKYTTLI